MNDYTSFVLIALFIVTYHKSMYPFDHFKSSYPRVCGLDLFEYAHSHNIPKSSQWNSLQYPNMEILFKRSKQIILYIIFTNSSFWHGMPIFVINSPLAL